MPTEAIIMAGGRSSRMRADDDRRHKALRVVAGQTLVERSVRNLLAYGFRSIAIAVSGAEAELRAFARVHARSVARDAGATLTCLVETVPLGTIGAVRALPDPAADLLVVNVDNISSIDLEELLAFHHASSAAMTIACHEEVFRLPFGELRVDGGSVHEYREKPAHAFHVSSGTYAVSRDAIRLVELGERLDVPELFARVKSDGGVVAAFRHTKSWIDVNDAAALRRAEAMIAAGELQ